MHLEVIQQTDTRSAFLDRLDQDIRQPALIAEEAIRNAIAAVHDKDAARVHAEVEYAKFVLIARRCGMNHHGCDLMAMMRSPGLSICSGLSNVSELAQRGLVAGSIPILAEAAMRVHALAA
jgi:hypothetical protein